MSTGRKFARVMSTGENLQELGALVGKICYSPGALLENLQELGSPGRKSARVRSTGENLQELGSTGRTFARVGEHW